MLPFVDSLVSVIAVLVACRAVMTLCYGWIALRAMPSLRGARPDWRVLGGLARFGGWLTISNLSWPLLLYLDRFVIAAVISTAASAWYATPFDLILRFSIVPIAIMQSGFPAMATAYLEAPEVATQLFRRGCLAILAAVALPSLLCTAAAMPLLTLWLGAPFAAHAGPVLQMLGLGALFMCLDTVPAGLLDAIGRPDVNAKLAVASAVAALPLLAGLLPLAGIEGAALAWTLRVIAGFALRMWLCARLYPPVREDLHRLLPALAAGMLAVAAGMVSGVVAVAFLALGAALLWRRGLIGAERAYLAGRISRAQ
ncbi:MAG: polysaccharide biosynthesis C-terminal domain-containing protein [Alphaproteobacteria bacterium]|nr:polysaccharide biosynthesis C-terminal domain-containing protein [Alphaproteobacteria bacterium]